MSSKPGPANEYTGPADFNQQAPEQGTGSEIYQLVLHDIITRSEFGARKYGHPLRTSADVDYLVNAYQEILDLLIYLRGEIHRRDKSKTVTCTATTEYTFPQGVAPDPCGACLGTSSDPHTCKRHCCGTSPDEPHRETCETQFKGGKR